MSKKIKVSFTTEIIKPATIEQIEDWVRFQLVGGGLSMDNPLCDEDIDADFGSVEVEEL